MSKLSQFELHALCLGKLLGNLQSMETAARLFLDKYDSNLKEQFMSSLPGLRKGDWVELSPLTDKRDLRPVLERYNKLAPDYRVDVERIVNLRDALAHGRVFGHGPMQTANSLRLLKFERKGRDGKVQVAMIEDMTEAWFDETAAFLVDSLEKIRLALDWEKTDIRTHT